MLSREIQKTCASQEFWEDPPPPTYFTVFTEMSTLADPPPLQEYDYGTYCFLVEQERVGPPSGPQPIEYELRDTEKALN